MPEAGDDDAKVDPAKKTDGAAGTGTNENDKLID